MVFAENAKAVILEIVLFKELIQMIVEICGRPLPPSSGKVTKSFRKLPPCLTDVVYGWPLFLWIVVIILIQV